MVRKVQNERPRRDQGAELHDHVRGNRKIAAQWVVEPRISIRKQIERPRGITFREKPLTDQQPLMCDDPLLKLGLYGGTVR